MQPEMQALLITAVSIAVLHTATGPDHYLPFIVLARSRQWSMAKTIGWTLTCGMGHVWSSVVLGLGGAALGWSVQKIGWAEGVRGGLASWGLLLFGIVYLAWGLYRAASQDRHKHFDVDEQTSDIYVYEHRHGQTVTPAERHRVTPWVMFLVFVLGPCEPMIPLLYFPAAQQSWQGMVVLVLVYTVVTLATMLAMVLMGLYGASFFHSQKLEKHMHALAGLALTICGAGMVFLGW